MKSSRLEKDKKIEENIIKDVRNLFKIKQKIDDTRIKDVRNIFRLKKEIVNITYCFSNIICTTRANTL